MAFHIHLLANAKTEGNTPVGVMSFMLTQLNVEAVMSGFPPAHRAYFLSFPL